MQIVAAVIVALGAFVGVVLGASYAADRVTAQMLETRQLFEDRIQEDRQLFEAQLEAESRRLQMQLDAESERLDRQLRADRAKQNRSEVRDVLDAGAATITESSMCLTNVSLEVMAVLAEKELGTVADADDVLDAVANAIPVAESLSVLWQRLLLRFRSKDPITLAAKAAMEHFSQAVAALDEPRATLEMSHLESLAAQKELLNKDQGNFLGECRHRFGVEDE